LNKDSHETIRIRYRRKLFFGLLLIAGTIALGVAGFMILERYTLIEAIYMTVITLGTVGFNEVKPLDNVGRIFTTILILLNLAIFAYAISSISTLIAEGDFKKYIRFLRLENHINKLRDHIIVCGYGRNGKQVCEVLESNHQPFVVIESSEEILKVLEEKPGMLFVEGNATDDHVLEKAGVKNAKALVSTLPNDPDNVYVVLTAKELNPAIHVVSRASHESSELKLKRAGADHIIMPEKIGGSFMASLILNPDMMEFISAMTGGSDMDFSFEEIPCEPISQEKNLTLKDLHLFRQFKTLVIGIKRSNGEYISNPSANVHITPDTKLIILGTRTQIEKMKAAHFQLREKELSK
jgi:voltage-gated potassium channel